MSGTIFEFGDFTLDCARFELRRAGRILKLEKKPMELLILLAARHGEVVTRTEIAERLWEREVFVDTEHGINTAVRKIRQVLRDNPERPRFVQTVTGKGYRFVGDAIAALEAVHGNGAGPTAAKEAVGSTSQDSAQPAVSSLQSVRRRSAWPAAAGACAVLAIVGATMYPSLRSHPVSLKYTQLTDFTDSATAPVLSPDGRMIAFFRGSAAFETADQIWVKMLPNGQPKRLTDDPRLKYGPAFSPDGSQIAYSVLAHPDFATYTVSTLGGDSHLFCTTRLDSTGWTGINFCSRQFAPGCIWEWLLERIRERTSESCTFRRTSAVWRITLTPPRIANQLWWWR